MAHIRAVSDLVRVRDLLNTWRVDGSSQLAEDRLDEVVGMLQLDSAEAKQLRQLRDDLRSIVEGDQAPDPILSDWLLRTGLGLNIQEGHVVFGRDASAVDRFLASVVGCINDGTWFRLKPCPGCRWIFVDRSRNASRVWCTMTGAENLPNGRSCGNIAKAQRWRERQRLSQARGSA